MNSVKAALWRVGHTEGISLYFINPLWFVLQLTPVADLSFESMAFKLYNAEVKIFPEDDNWCT